MNFMGHPMTKMNNNVTAGIKNQASGGTHRLYRYLHLKGGGMIFNLMKIANKTKDYTDVDWCIKEGLKPFLYNEGRGKTVHIREVVKARIRDRGYVLGRASHQPNSLDVGEMDQLTDTQTDWLRRHGTDKFPFLKPAVHCHDFAQLPTPDSRLTTVHSPDYLLPTHAVWAAIDRHRSWEVTQFNPHLNAQKLEKVLL